MENDFNMISGEIVKETETMASKAEKFSQKIQDEINEFFEELSS